MSTPPDQLKLLSRLNETWSGSLKLSLNADEITNLANHPLSGEVSALFTGARSSLPYFSGDEVVWLTTAGDAEGLIAAIEDLRAWILPNFGWEDEKPLVTPGESVGTLGGLIHSISPAGYFRWRTARRDFPSVLKKLSALRRLEAAQPVHIHVRVPALIELRNQFDVAMLTGDREAAQEAIDTINHHQLDTAVNTRFMQVLVWNQFREYERIATDPSVAELVQLRMPQLIRLCVVQAFHAHFIAPHEDRGDAAAAAESYVENVHDLLAGLLDLCRPGDSLEARRSKGYKAWFLKDAFQAKEILAECDDELLTQLLAPLRPVVSPPPPLDEQFMTALQQGDWRALQEVGTQLLEPDVQRASAISREFLQSSLTVSLNIQANAALAEKLEHLADSSLSPSGPPSPVVPQTWSEFFECLNNAEWEAASRFLTLDDRPSAYSSDVLEVKELLDALEELFTNPDIHQSQTGFQMVVRSLPIIINDFVAVRAFPQAELTPVYKQLLDLWAEHKKGSASTPDANLLLLLADAVLPHSSGAEAEVAEAIRGWWQARKVRAMLPFLLNGLDMLSQFMSDRAVCESLWIDGAEFIRLDPGSLTSGERALWRNIGTRIGLDAATISEFLGFGTEIEEDTPDLIVEANLRKVAIVSLREEAAHTAADLIRQRTDADVIVVTETHAGTDTNSAKLADVILFVWSSSTHAVYRAFDNVREKLEYVQGTGAMSIVLALERWAMKQR
jgi:hypothetical protein